MIAKAQKQYTVKDYKLFEESDPHQLLNGELIALGEPAPTYGHQGIVTDILTQIRFFLKNNPIGEVRCAPIDVYFDEKNVLQPDIVFVSNKRNNIIYDDGLHGAPDMIIEILSPSTNYYDTNVKKRIYEKYDVKEYWIINPDNDEVIGYENIDQKFQEFYRGYEKFSSKMLNLDVSIRL